MLPLKVLFLAANPDDQARLALDAEYRDIQTRVQQRQRDRKLVWESVWAVRIDDIPDALLKHRPHIVHFSGHGDGADNLLLADEERGSRPIAADSLAEVFRVLGDNIRLVVFNTCFSLALAQAVTEYVDCAIGIEHQVNDVCARVFAGHFYQAICYGRSVLNAFEVATVAVRMHGFTVTPRLLVRGDVEPDHLCLLAPTGPGPDPLRQVEPSRVRIELTLEGVVSSLLVSEIERVIDVLRTHAGDMQLCYKFERKGSLMLVLGMEDELAAARLYIAHICGKLSALLEHVIGGLRVLRRESDDGHPSYIHVPLDGPKNRIMFPARRNTDPIPRHREFVPPHRRVSRTAPDRATYTPFREATASSDTDSPFKSEGRTSQASLSKDPEQTLSRNDKPPTVHDSCLQILSNPTGYISLVVVTRDGRHLPLRPRMYADLVKVLAQAVHKDQQDPALPSHEHGWLDVDDVMHRLGISDQQLNLYIHRARSQLEQAGIVDARSHLIERRHTPQRRQIRLGMSHIELVT